MKISYNWLKDYYNTSLSPEEISVFLTDCGLEVEALEEYHSVKGGLEGFVIGEVLTKEKHPDADRLSVTSVNIGAGEPLNIVCGAPNVEAGQKVVVATIGTTIHSEKGEFTISKSKIRGKVSEGMICAEDEMGLGKSHEGILVLEAAALVGMPAKEYFNIYSDSVFEIGLTPNRIDAASHYGVARDLAAVLNSRNADITKATLPSVDAFTLDSNDLKIDVIVENPEACHRYSGITIKNVTVTESPEWLRNRILAIGLRPINNIVDITNYVLQELAQPLHAFDADKIEGGKVIVKKLEKGTKFTTLDEVERTLGSDDLMICNEKEGMCIAGVFGGTKSGVTGQTKNIFLESACFEPVHIRKTSKFHGLKTDASFRFERGTDPNITIYALKRAALLIKEIAGGTISSEIIDIYPQTLEDFKVDLKFENVDKLIGKQIPRDTIQNILNSLEIGIVSSTPEMLVLNVPRYRIDVQREADVIEEILRIYGYNNIELPDSMKISLSSAPFPDREKLQNLLSDFLSSNGFHEILNNSLTNPIYVEKMKLFSSEENVKLLNPLSNELAVMRQSLLFGGLETIGYNLNRKNNNLKLYEFGKTYRQVAGNIQEGSLPGYNEKYSLSLFLSGSVAPESWQTGKGHPMNFYLLKAYVNNILKRVGVDFTKLKAEQLSNDMFAEALSYSAENRIVAVFGRISNNLLKQFDIKQDVFFADIDWDMVVRKSTENKVEYSEISKFPQVRRDLALLIDKKVHYSEIEKIILNIDKQRVTEVNLFDIYQGDKIDPGKKSYAVSIMLQDKEKTLTDEEIDAIMKKIISSLSEKLNAVLR
jgi:phenylalanyl-tRNA synthetase beta chain